MLVIPTIDLMNGHAVRLEDGDRDKATVYSEEPWTLVKAFVEAGAERIHVIDLDGAFAGAQEHRAVVRRILAKSVVPIQVGGGIRNRQVLDLVFGNGAKYAVIGTAAVKDPEFVSSACADYPGRIIVSVDNKDGQVAVEGRQEETYITAPEVARRAEAWGASAVLYTNVARNRTDGGADVSGAKELVDAVSIPVISACGVNSLDELHQLKEAGVAMVIVGRSLYEKRFELRDAIQAVQ